MRSDKLDTEFAAAAAASGIGFGPQGENLSIRIPNYNGAKTLGETIASVLAQGEQVARAEICVLDNKSTDHSEAVVREAGGGRVGFVQHEENKGALFNINLCLTGASRLWVHILHSDDAVLPGGYNEVDRVVCENPDCDTVFGRAVYMDEKSRWTGTTTLLGPEMRGVMEYDPLRWQMCPIQFVGAFLRKDCVQATGGFRMDLECATDWNLWWRIAKYRSPAYTNVCVGAYRISSGNGTSRGLRTGVLINDTLRHLREFSEAEGANATDEFGPMFDLCLNECAKLFHEGDSFRTNMNILKQFPLTAKRRAKLARMEMRFVRSRMKSGKAVQTP